ncbi:MAG: hypothetical protein MK102_09480 [Fuerstiella sp.]|nr:hypothetical protein [Fuerstiella sp.]
MIIGLVLHFSAAFVSAESKISFRQLTRTFPIAVQQGSTAAVEVSSNFTLNDSHSVFFAPAGPEMELAETEAKPDEWKDPAESDIGTPFAFRVCVPQDQPTGIYEYRIATDQSVSSIAHLVVTEYPVIVESDNNNDTPATAQKVSVPSAVCGTVANFEDVDYYRIHGKKGQQLICQIFAQRVTRAIHCMAIRYPKIHLMDSILTLYDSTGRVVALNDNHIGGDALLRLTLPYTGDFILEVRDTRFSGDPRYVYCVEFTHTTPQSGIPSDAAYQDSPGTSPQSASTISFPDRISGQFAEPGQSHYYAFTALKNNFYRFEVHSQRLGFSLDSVLTVSDGSGTQLSTGDDSHFTKDAQLYFQAPENAAYTVAVRDLNGRCGDRFQYQLSAELSGPDFEIHGEYYYGMLAPGGQAIWFVKLKRLNGFDGPVKMQVEGLPQGVTFTPVTIPSGMNHCGLIFTAAENAPVNASLVRVSGRANLPGSNGQTIDAVRHAHVTAEIRRAGASRFYRTPVTTQLLGVTRPLDLTGVTTSPTQLTLQRGGTTQFTVNIERSPEYSDQVLLDMAFSFFSTKYGEQLPPGVKMSPDSKTKLTGDDLEATIVLEATPEALAVHRLPIAALARVPITYSIMTNYASNPMYLTVEDD